MSSETGHQKLTQAHACLAHGGAMAALIRSMDWEATDLGPMEAWAPELRMIVGLCLSSSFPMVIWWGPELIQIYNEAYIPILGGTKHPSAMGGPARATWPEIWQVLTPLLSQVLEAGEPVRRENMKLVLHRNGGPEECYFTFSYTAIRDGAGTIAGMIIIPTETTAQVLGERRMATLRELTVAAPGTSEQDTLDRCSAVLRQSRGDIPFAFVYLCTGEAGAIRLVLETGHSMAAAPENWPLEEVIERGEAEWVPDLPESGGVYLLPLAGAEPGRILGVMACGVNPQLRLDEQYTDFFLTVSRQIARAIGEARAQERERERLEEQRQLQAVLQGMLNEAPLGVCMLDVELRVRYVNPYAWPLVAELPGVIGKPVGEILRAILSQGATEHLLAQLEDTLETGKACQAPEFRTLRNGHEKPEYYSYQIHRMMLPDGSLGVVIYFNDVTSYVETRQGLACSEARLRFLAEAMPQKIFTALPDGSVNYRNRQWTEFSGLPGERWDQIVHPDDAEESVREWRKSLGTGQPFEVTHRFRRADGMYRWHLTRIVPMWNLEGSVVLWIGSSTEIHGQKEIEEEVRRTNEALSQFAYAASHDLQEPLRMVNAYAHLLTKRYSSAGEEPASTYVRFIESGVNQMRTLLADLLAYTELGAEEQGTEWVELNAIFESVTKGLHVVMEESGAVITSDALPVVRGNGIHFVQLFQNLFTNAIKYRSEAPPRIHVSAGWCDGAWRIGVADNGMGIAPEYHETIFGVFKRLHGRGIPGTGIGLAICQRVVTRYGGRIWVESRCGHGATFYFNLPKVQGETR